MASGLVTLAVVAGACSGGSTDGVASLEPVATISTIADADQSDEEAVLGFTQCMRAEGIDLPDPSVDSDGNLQLNLGRAAASIIGIDEELLNAAFLKCQEFLEGVTFGFDAGDTAAFEDRLVGFASCMRGMGIDLPDPDFSAVGSDDLDQGPFGALDLEDPDFQAALDVCGDVLAGFSPP